MKIQLLTFPGCPNASAARETLRTALVSAGMDANVEEIDLTSRETPEQLRGWGSPTVLIDGIDIAGEQTPSGTSCRLYRDVDGRLRGVPSQALVLAALRRRPER